MKTNKFFFLALFLMGMLAGCSSVDTSTPEATAKAFFEAMKAKDKDAMMELVISEDQMKAMIEATDEDEDRKKRGLERVESDRKRMAGEFEDFWAEVSEEVDMSKMELGEISAEKKDRKGMPMARVSMEVTADGDKETLEIMMAETADGWRLVGID